MKQLIAISLLALTAAAPLVADDYREIRGSHELASGQDLHVDFHSGEVQFEAGSGNKVSIEVELDCKWRDRRCEDLLDEVELRWRSNDRRLYLEVEGLASWERARVEVDATITYPRSAALFVDMAAGSLEIEGATKDIRVDMGAGEVRVWMDEASVEMVSVDVGIGEAKFRGQNDFVAGRRSNLIGSEVYWDDGPGDARVDVELGVGDASVYLD